MISKISKLTVFGITIYELLLRECFEFVVFNEVGSLKGSYGREGIACAALSLVLDCIKAFFNPIYVIGNVGVFRVEDLFEVLDNILFFLIS